MLVKCVTTCDSRFTMFGRQTSKNNQDVWKLVVLCASLPLYVYIVLDCCLESKLIGDVPNI